jgi:hypothetical protein
MRHHRHVPGEAPGITHPSGHGDRGSGETLRPRSPGRVVPDGELQLELAPVRGRPGFYAATLPDGRCLLRASRQPTHEAARVLLAQGVSPQAVITTRHAGGGTVATQTTVGEAARWTGWTVKERDRGGLSSESWAAGPMACRSSPGVPENGRGDPGPARSLAEPSRPSTGVMAEHVLRA